MFANLIFFYPLFSIFPLPVILGLIFGLAAGFSFFFFLDYPMSNSCAKLIHMLPHVGESKTILYSGFDAVDFGF